MNYADYLKTDYWKAVSDAVKKRADYRCQLCNSQHDLCAHHRTYDHRGRELEHLSDLTCLCRRCHEIFHGKVPQQAMVVEKPLPAKKQLPAPESLGLSRNSTHVVLTGALIARCRTPKGGFTSFTLEALGIINATKGWPARMVGKTITVTAYQRAVAGASIFAGEKRRLEQAATLKVLKN